MATPSPSECRAKPRPRQSPKASASLQGAPIVINALAEQLLFTIPRQIFPGWRPNLIALCCDMMAGKNIRLIILGSLANPTIRQPIADALLLNCFNREVPTCLPDIDMVM